MESPLRTFEGDYPSEQQPHSLPHHHHRLLVITLQPMVQLAAVDLTTAAASALRWTSCSAALVAMVVRFVVLEACCAIMPWPKCRSTARDEEMRRRNTTNSEDEQTRHANSSASRPLLRDLPQLRPSRTRVLASASAAYAPPFVCLALDDHKLTTNMNFQTLNHCLGC